VEESVRTSRSNSGTKSDDGTNTGSGTDTTVKTACFAEQRYAVAKGGGAIGPEEQQPIWVAPSTPIEVGQEPQRGSASQWTTVDGTMHATHNVARCDIYICTIFCTRSAASSSRFGESHV